MRVKVLFIISLVCLFVSIFYIADLLKEDFILTKNTEYDSTIEIWTVTTSLTPIIKNFQNELNVKVNHKRFIDDDSLIEELKLAKINDDFPDLIEVSSNYSMDEVVSEFSVFSIEQFMEDGSSPFHKSIINSFSDKDILYAYPLGIEIPLIFKNKSILKKFSTDRMYPFLQENDFKDYQKKQKEIRKNLRSNFWLFHFDEDLPLYWSAHESSRAFDKDLLFEDTWEWLISEYELLPPLDSHMAITRFTNYEIGALITTSKQIQTIQHLVGNSFELEVSPFIPNEDDNLYVIGNGFVILNENERINDFFSYMSRKEIQLELLSKAGWIPAHRDHLNNNYTFINQLPMAKYIKKIIEHEEQFFGRSFNESTIDQWQKVLNIVENIEKED